MNPPGYKVRGGVDSTPRGFFKILKKGIYSLMLKISEAVHSFLGHILMC